MHQGNQFWKSTDVSPYSLTTFPNFLDYTGVSGVEGNSQGIHSIFHLHFPRRH